MGHDISCPFLVQGYGAAVPRLGGRFAFGLRAGREREEESTVDWGKAGSVTCRAIRGAFADLQGENTMRKRLTALFSILGLAGPVSAALPAGAQDKPKGASTPAPTAPNTPQTVTQKDADLKKQQEELAHKEAARQLELKLQKEAMHIKMHKADAEQQSEKNAGHIKMQKTDAGQQSDKQKVYEKWNKSDAEIKGEKGQAAIKMEKNAAELKAEKDRQAIKLDKNAAANKAAKSQAPVVTPPQPDKQP